MFSLGDLSIIFIVLYAGYSIGLHWLEHFWNNENMFETGVVRANEC